MLIARCSFSFSVMFLASRSDTIGELASPVDACNRQCDSDEGHADFPAVNWNRNGVPPLSQVERQAAAALLSTVSH